MDSLLTRFVGYISQLQQNWSCVIRAFAMLRESFEGFDHLGIPPPHHVVDHYATGSVMHSN